MFLLTTAVGDVLGGLLYDVAEGMGVSNTGLLGFCAAVMFVVSGVFVRFSMGYEYRVQGGEEAEGGEIEFSLVQSGEEEEEERGGEGEGKDKEQGGGLGLDMRRIEL